MKLREDLVLRHVGDDHIIVDPAQDMVDMSKVFTLNDSAAWLWEKLAGQEFMNETVVELLSEEYDLSYEQARADAQGLIENFGKNGLLNKDAG
ncbi:PqqD family protein [Pedobacter sp. AW31-3R]|uniref:PqqD family protein n=1 Tax=Pedobacter sp. AW31-3R TaxID=3445781 RepID=UPI003FA14B64